MKRMALRRVPAGNLLVTLMMILAGCSQMPTITSPDSSSLSESGVSGSHDAVMEEVSSLPGYTLYRPAEPLAGARYPLLVWGNGACRDIGNLYEGFHRELASHGYIVIAIGPVDTSVAPPQPSSPVPTDARPASAEPRPALGTETPASMLLDAIDWAERQSQLADSEYGRILDMDRIAAMGHSCGGAQAAWATLRDDRIDTLVWGNSGAREPPLPDAEVLPGELSDIRVPVMYLVGGPTDVAYPVAERDFDRYRAGVPVFKGNVNVGHGGTYGDSEGGEYARATLAWLNWHLKDDEESAQFFRGEDCVLCEDPAWSVERRGLDEASVARVLEGKLDDGTDYRIDIPADWNGMLLLDLDHAGRIGNRPDPIKTALLKQGYGLAGTTRAMTGWAVHESVENLVRVADLASEQFGTPGALIAYGSSLGGHTAMVATQMYPERFAGGISLCMSPAGAVGVWNGKMDALFVARQLLAPDSDLPIMDVPEDFRETALPAWQRTLRDAQQTPQGRARIALAAVLGQLPDWSMPDKPIPEPDDIQARQAGLYDSLSAHRLPLIGQAMSSRHQLKELAGGNISWNIGFDYRQALNQLEGRELVEALYEQAGLSLDADLEALARAPRIEADPQALDYMAPQVYSGDLAMPILTLHATGDQVAPIDSVQAFAQSVEDAGKGTLLKQVFTQAAGHCPFSAGETVALVDVMSERLSSGSWPDMSAVRMNERAGRIGGQARYIDYQPEIYLRPFDRDDLEAGRYNQSVLTDAL